METFLPRKENPKKLELNMAYSFTKKQLDRVITSLLTASPLMQLRAAIPQQMMSFIVSRFMQR